MSLTPNLEIGLLNAWIFIIPYLIYWFVANRLIFTKRKIIQPYSKKTMYKIFFIMFIMTYIFSYFYSIFLPIRFDTIWFFIGLIVYIIAFIIETITIIDFIKTPLDKPVTKGAYHFSRNPMALGEATGYIGIAIACLSWVYFLIAALYLFFINYILKIEEKITFDRYGKDYEIYLKKTPKWIGLINKKKNKNH